MPRSAKKLSLLIYLLYPKFPSVDEAAHAAQYKTIVETATQLFNTGNTDKLTKFLHTLPNLATRTLTPLDRYKALGSITAMLIRRGAL